MRREHKTGMSCKGILVRHRLSDRNSMPRRTQRRQRSVRKRSARGAKKGVGRSAAGAAVGVANEEQVSYRHLVRAVFVLCAAQKEKPPLPAGRARTQLNCLFEPWRCRLEQTQVQGTPSRSVREDRWWELQSVQALVIPRQWQEPDRLIGACLPSSS